MNVSCIRRWSSICLDLCLGLSIALASGNAWSQAGGEATPPAPWDEVAPAPLPPVSPAATQDPAVSGVPAVGAAPEQEVSPGVLSTENLVAQLDASYRAYVSVLGGYFRRPAESEHNFEAVRSAVVALAAEGVDKVLAGNNGGGQRLLKCLAELSEDGVLAAELASLAQRSGRPGFVQEYLRTWCNVPLGSPYARGKVAVPGAKVGKLTGDIVADKAMVWLTADRGFVGGANGHPDPGEWVDLKFSITNRAKKQTYQGATARLVVLGEKDAPCPIWPPLDPEAPVFSPAGCDVAVAVGPPAPMADLSPGEHVTVGTFGLVLTPGLAASSVALALVIEAPGAQASMTKFALPVGKPPLLEVAGLTVDDDASGQSRGNGNGRIEPGERIELKAQLAAVGVKQFSKVAVSAHQFSGFLDLAPRVLGLASLVEKKPASLGGDFQFEIPTIEAMAAVPADRLDRQFFMDREVNLWVAASGCAGKADVAKDWAAVTPSSYLCPAGSPGYRYVLPVALSIEFDQVLVINTVPSGARIRVNGVLVGETGKGIPVVFTQLSPVRNSILYYQVSAEAPGYETRLVEVPVIYKDRTAGNLTSTLNLELKVLGPAEPAEPPPAVEPPAFWEEAKPRVEPVPPEPSEPPETGGFFLNVGGVWRALGLDFEDSGQMSDLVSPDNWSGFEMGGGYQFGRFFFLSLDSSVLFPVNAPTITYQESHPVAGKTEEDTGAKSMSGYNIRSPIAWTLCAQPGFQASWGPVGAQAGVGFQLEGMSSDDPEPFSNSSVESSAHLATLGYSARLSAGLSLRLVDGLRLYARSLFAVPRNDWGVSGGVRLDLF